MNLFDLSRYKLCYLATPFTNHPEGHFLAHQEASWLAGEAMLAGATVFSPIAHSFPICSNGRTPVLDQDFWERQNAPFIHACDALLVGMLDSWELSEGVAHEIEEFKSAGKPIFYVYPDTLEVLNSEPV